MRGAYLALGLLCVLASFSSAGRETALLVTYGPEAPRQEGDDDSLQVLFLEVPEATKGPLYVRIFDPETGGRHDHVFAGPDTSTRFSLYGGEGAARAAGLQPDPESLAAGVLLNELDVAEDGGLDDVWHTLARIDPRDGEAVADGRLFRLVVRGERGNDANVYDVTVSRSAHRNTPPEGLKISNHEPTFRLAGVTPAAEARFEVPRGVKTLLIKSFDAAGAPMTLETPTRSISLLPSGQGDYAETLVEIEESETGRLAAITLSRGGENPNDVVFSVTDPEGRSLPLEWPVYSRRSRARLDASIRTQPLADCRSMLFQVSSSGAVDREELTYDWEFGDGNSGRGNHIVHRFAAPGEYRVRLAATTPTDPLGVVSDFAVTVNQAPIAVASGDRTIAPGVPARFDATSSRDQDGRILNYAWDFGDSVQAQGSEVAHSFSEPGLYGVILRVEDDHDGPCNFANDRLFIRVNSPPVAEAGETVLASVGETVVFDAGRSYDTDGQIVRYEWDFGERGTAAGAQVEKTFEQPGQFVAVLAVRDDAKVANSTATDRVNVLVNVPPSAQAGADRSLAVGESSLFDGSGSADPDGRIINYQWDFGDGGRGRGLELPYAFREPGRYTVTLSVRDDSPAASGIDSDQLVVLVNAPPVADAGEPQSVTASEVRFDAAASHDPDGTIIEYRWDFGDGGQGDGATPIHVYSEPGIYLATVTVVDDSGTPRNLDQDSVAVIVNERPLADAGPDRVVAPGETLYFSAQGSIDPDGAIASYEWDFGDGTRATGLGASHGYERPGLYTVRLAVGDDSGDATAVDYDEAVVRVNAQPVARAGVDGVVAPGQIINFDARNSYDPDGQISAYRWVFSDGESVAEASARRSFSKPGIYTATLEIEDDSGARNARNSDELVVRVNHQPRAAAGKDRFTCDSVARFDGTASVDADSDTLAYLWDLGDGSVALGATVSHVYAEGGTYPVTLTVDDGQGLENSRHSEAVVVRVNRHPVAIPGDDITACAGEVVLFDGSGSSDPDGDLLRYLWDFGDDTGAEEVNPSKIYKQGGTYSASLRVVDDSGLACSADVEKVSVQVAESPTAEAGQDMTVCANTAVAFDGTDSRDFDGVVNRYRWDFGDGSRGGGATPEHIFTEAGVYRVRLTVTGDQAGSCDNTDTDEALVTVLAAPAPQIVGRRQVPVNQAVTFDAGGSTSADAEIVSWRWNFGDGGTAQGAEVSYTWTTPGRYPLRLTLGTDGGTDCNTVQAEQTVIVNQAPEAVAGEDQVVGTHQLVEFDAGASRDGDGVIVNYAWDFGDGETGQGVQVRHRYKSSGRYDVRLQVQDNMNLENSTAADSLEVMVNAAPVAVIAVPEPACPEQATVLSAAQSEDVDGEIVDFRWLFGDGDQGSGSETSHVYARPGRYHVTLLADDGLGVSNSLQQTTLLLAVNNPPAADAGRNHLVCPGEPVLFDGSGSFDLDGELQAASWIVSDGAEVGQSREYDGLTAEHAFEQPGRYNASLVVSDDSGARCAAATDNVAVRVNAPPIADAGPDREAFLGGAHDAILFDASGSSDPDQDPLSFIWDLGDGSRKAGARVYHNYARPGRYVVKLLVDDGTASSCGKVVDEAVVEAKTRTADG